MNVLYDFLEGEYWRYRCHHVVGVFFRGLHSHGVERMMFLNMILLLYNDAPNTVTHPVGRCIGETELIDSSASTPNAKELQS
jgi:hypothetical protein